MGYMHIPRLCIIQFLLNDAVPSDDGDDDDDDDEDDNTDITTARTKIGCLW